MLLNSPSNFLTYHTLHALLSIIDQCDSQQLLQIEHTLLSYSPPKETARSLMKSQLLETIKLQIDFSISDIIPNSYWWQDVESKFFNSLSGVLRYQICGLQVIRNKFLFERFNDYRIQLGQNTPVIFVYHGSSSDALKSIAKIGFLQRQVVNNKPELLKEGTDNFGCGIYHGFAADYAIYYAEHYRKSNEIMLSMVLPGRSYIVKKGGEKHGKECERGFDSHISPEEKEIVVFKSAQILPLFIIRFMRAPNAPVVEEKI